MLEGKKKNIYLSKPKNDTTLMKYTPTQMEWRVQVMTQQINFFEKNKKADKQDIKNWELNHQDQL